MKRLLLLLAVAVAAQAQPASTNTYTITCPLALSGTAKACTLQQPASGARNVQMVAAYIRTDATVLLTQERNGTAASGTAVTERPTNPDTQAASAAQGFTDSNVGVGTLVTDTDAIKVAAGGEQTLDLAAIQLRGNSTAVNYSIRTNDTTANVVIVITYREF